MNSLTLAEILRRKNALAFRKRDVDRLAEQHAAAIRQMVGDPSRAAAPLALLSATTEAMRIIAAQDLDELDEMYGRLIEMAKEKSR